MDRRLPLLVVDNNEEFQRLIQRYLAVQVWRMLSIADVDNAALMARQRQPSAILLDVVISGRDDWELLQELQSAAATRAILLGVCSVLHEPDVAIALGATCYLRKPISQDQLLTWLASLASPSSPAASAVFVAEAGT